MWTALRKDIDAVLKVNNIPDTHFKPVGMYDWQEIERNMYQHFFISKSSEWLWEHFKTATYAVSFAQNWPFFTLLQLIDSQEKVWLILNDGDKKQSSFWLYEGLINTIVFVLGESTTVDEVYIVSQKYEWILCINHHDVLIASGELMINKLKQSEKQLLAMQ